MGCGRRREKQQGGGWKKLYIDKAGRPARRRGVRKSVRSMEVDILCLLGLGGEGGWGGWGGLESTVPGDPCGANAWQVSAVQFS